MRSCANFLRLPFFITTLASSTYVNEWPIVGIFAQPVSDLNSPCNGNCQYIAASYVKYVESTGARVVPINFYAKTSELDKLMSSLNGIIFPGGGAGFTTGAQYVFDSVVRMNDSGDFFPLLGTCMGFEWLLIAASKDANILDPKIGQMDAYNYSIPLDFRENAKNSRTFSAASQDIMKILSTENVTMNNHHYGIWTDHFDTTPSLTSFFNLLSTNKDRLGREFASTIEAFNYPIYGTQWHPEKNSFEWQKTEDGIPMEAINHSASGVAIAQYMANFFMSEVRKNNHTYPTPADEANALIYNYQPTQTPYSSFVQKYYFHF